MTSLVILMALWVVWFYPFVFRAPHGQKRKSISMAGPTRVGLLLECAGIGIAYAFPRTDVTPLQMAAAFMVAAIAVAMAWTSVTHLGRQFRVTAGLYEDHELVSSGPYGVVRHPIYCSLLGMLVCTILLRTDWQWALASLALFVVGTEIRVRAEDGLLASRFGEKFYEYQRKVPAYLPFVR